MKLLASAIFNDGGYLVTIQLIERKQVKESKYWPNDLTIAIRAFGDDSDCESLLDAVHVRFDRFDRPYLTVEELRFIRNEKALRSLFEKEYRNKELANEDMEHIDEALTEAFDIVS
jgi:hypothetical protein